MTQANPSVSQAPVSINDGAINISASDIRIKKFWASLAAYRQSQTTILLVMAKEEAPDEEMDEAIDEQRRAIHNFLATPIGILHQLFPKFEVVEELIIQEDLVGKSMDNYPVLALASLKRDLLQMDDEKYNRKPA